MADEYTSNYNFFLPKGSDSMALVEKNITDAFKAIEPRNDVTVIGNQLPLPQSGSYNVGDRVFRNDTVTGTTWPSSYILICKDANWGWHWRPVQQILSPWVTVPATAIDLTTDWELHPTIKFEIALDSRGWCHWRGAIRRKTAGIPVGTTFNIFKNIPLGIRPNVKFMHTIALSPITGSALGKAGNIGGRLYMQNDGYSSFRFFNSANGVSQNIWLDGLHYNNSDSWYYSG